MSKHPGHHAADDIVHGTGLSRATTYHVLSQLERAGLIRAFNVPGRLLYELNDVPHQHLLCDNCGELFDVPANVEPKPISAVGTVHKTEVLFYGVCRDCQRSLS